MSDIYESTITYELLGQGCASVFHWLGVDMTTSRLLCDLIISTGLPLLRDILGNDTDITAVHVKNITSLDDIVQANLTGFSGNRGGSTTTTFVAWDFTKHVASPATRSGAMRPPGVAETDITDGVPDPTFVPNLEDWATWMATQYQNVGPNWTLAPIVAGQTNPTFIIANPVVDGSHEDPTSQNSRKKRTASNITLTAAQELLTVDVGSPPSVPAFTLSGKDVIDFGALIGVEPPYSVAIGTLTITPI